MEEIISFCKKKGVCLSIPRIGCGLTGGDWNIVKDIVEKAAEDSGTEITVYELKHMPTYQFHCSACGNDFDHFQTFTEFDKGELPNCACGQQAQREATAPLFIFDSTPKTVGTLAERNTHKFGSYHREKIEREHEESAKKARKALSPNSSGVMNNKGKFKTYWPKMSSKALKKMNKQQLKKYITSNTEPKEM